MTQQQHDHISRLLREFGDAGYEKFAESCAEHDAEGDGNLLSLADGVLIDHVMNELLGLWLYAATLREKILKMKK